MRAILIALVTIATAAAVVAIPGYGYYDCATNTVTATETVTATATETVTAAATETATITATETTTATTTKTTTKTSTKTVTQTVTQTVTATPTASSTSTGAATDTTSSQTITPGFTRPQPTAIQHQLLDFMSAHQRVGDVQPSLFSDVKLGKLGALNQQALQIDKILKQTIDKQTAIGVYSGTRAFIKCAPISPLMQYELNMLKILEKAETDKRKSIDSQNYIVRLLHNFEVNSKFDASTCFVLSYGGDRTLAEYAKQTMVTTKKKELPAMLEQVIRGVAYLHRAKIAHTNISPSNIIVNRKSTFAPPTIMIVNFTQAQQLEFDNSGNLEPNLAVMSNSLLKAPESFWELPINLQKYDSWTIGATFYYAAFGRFPFEKKYLEYRNTNQTILFVKMMQNLSNNALNEILPPSKLSFINKKLLSSFTILLRKLLVPDASQRPTPEAYIDWIINPKNKA
ncbi:kinase-like domain-containing protein [Syncephalis fuscata]|nr:kinase-like domain-containing protein [Syncephalis fuscata]